MKKIEGKHLCCISSIEVDQVTLINDCSTTIDVMNIVYMIGENHSP